MKYFIPVLLSVVVLVSCSKTTKDTLSVPVQTAPEVCMFGKESFNLTTRTYIQDPLFIEMKGPKGGGNGGNGGGSTTPPPPPASLPVLLLDVDGHTVSNTQWNYAGDFVCSPANLSSASINSILQQVQIDYSPFNIIVTTDEALYNNAPSNKRMRIVITETWQWFGQAGGTSFIGSFTWGNNTPGFVFSSLLNYNTKFIAEACSHEAGHSLGLYHQSVYDGNCNKLSEYNSGFGGGETGWAPIMGNGYYQNMTLWHNGPNSTGCSNNQNEIATISNVVGQKTDDHGDNISSASVLSSSLDGIINSSSDQDFFKISFTGNKTVVLRPANIGAGNYAGNVDLSMKIYNSNGTLLQTVSNPLTLDAAVTLTSGTYYIAANTENNANSGVYGMVGSYTISLN